MDGAGDIFVFLSSNNDRNSYKKTDKTWFNGAVVWITNKKIE